VCSSPAWRLGRVIETRSHAVLHADPTNLLLTRWLSSYRSYGAARRLKHNGAPHTPGPRTSWGPHTIQHSAFNKSHFATRSAHFKNLFNLFLSTRSDRNRFALVSKHGQTPTSRPTVMSKHYSEHKPPGNAPKKQDALIEQAPLGQFDSWWVEIFLSSS